MMNERLISIDETGFPKGGGNAVRLDLAGLRKDHEYVGLWFACDRSEDTYITTLLYEAEGSARSSEPVLVIPENSFKRAPRQRIESGAAVIWIAARCGENDHCGLKVFPWIEDKSFINYKVTRTRGQSIETLKTGMIRGEAALFCKIGIEGGKVEIDYNDTILFLVAIKSLPPADWNFDPAAFGVQRLPMIVPVFSFSREASVTPWLGQNPYAGT